MNQQNPLKKNRLGLGGILLVSAAVLVGSSVFVIPEVGVLPGSARTTLPTVPPEPSPTRQSVEATAEPSDAALKSQGAAAGPAQPLVPVYWLGDVEGTDRLFREFLPAPAESTGDPIADAVRLMTEGRPLDPDYRSPWRPASSVSSSISTKNVITVDISADAVSQGLGQDEARLALQQLVYTATAAAANAGLIAGGEASSVVVLVDGAADFRAFDAVNLGGEWTRDTAVLAPVWIVDPQEGVEPGRTGFEIHGVARAAGRSVDWRIDRDEEGGNGGSALFRDGSVDIAPEEGAPGAYSFSVTLPPGIYEITVSSPVADGTAADSKNVVVR